MILGKGRRRDTARDLPPYANFVVQKVAPNLTRQRDSIVNSARNSFPRGLFESEAERALVKYGQATSQVMAIALAAAVRSATGKNLNDIEYGDCALTAAFLMRIPFRGFNEAIDAVIGDWITAFETDIHYLVFADHASISDLIEEGNDRFLHCEGNSDSKIPEAYFFLLAKVLMQRERGEWEPYRLLDHMLSPNPTLLASLDNAWPDIGNMIQDWMDTAQEVQKEAAKNDLEVWSWW